MKVKEFLNYQNAQEQMINDWLKDNPNVEIIDIKYSVGCFQESHSGPSEEFSGALILYKEL